MALHQAGIIVVRGFLNGFLHDGGAYIALRIVFSTQLRLAGFMRLRVLPVVASNRVLVNRGMQSPFSRSTFLLKRDLVRNNIGFTEHMPTSRRGQAGLRPLKLTNTR